MGIIHHWGLKGTKKSSRGRAQPCDNCQDMSQPWNMWSLKRRLKKMGGNPQTVRGTDDSLVMMVNDYTAQCNCTCLGVVTYCEQITWKSFEGTSWLADWSSLFYGWPDHQGQELDFPTMRINIFANFCDRSSGLTSSTPSNFYPVDYYDSMSRSHKCI